MQQEIRILAASIFSSGMKRFEWYWVKKSVYSMPLLKELAHGFAHLLYPKICEGCRTPLMQQEDTLCIACLQELPHTGFHLIPDNEAALRFPGRIPYQYVTALAHFTPDGLLQHLLHRLKYHNKKQIGLFLGKQLGGDLMQSDWSQKIDLIIPVPLHPKKEAVRGYNQSALIATGISELTGKENAVNILKRIRHTESQTQKSREERFRNVKDAFEVRDARSIEGKHVLLVDDVLTTGATLEAAATALLQASGTTVSIATIGLADS